MKKIFFILMLTMSSSYAKPCMTDIYFGNGVWNSSEQVLEGKDALRRLMFSIPSSRLNRSLEGEEYNFKYAYNPSEGTSNDLLETFYQLKDSGQVSNNYFLWIFTLLNNDESTEPYQKLQDIIRTHNDDASYMFTMYEQASFNQKHNVLLVAHSQGNLFGNKMYTLMSNTQRKKFRMVSVSTPANHVSGNGPHVTATGDYVIRPIPGSLPSNISGFGHTFIGTYLNVPGGGALGDSSENSPKMIASHVNNAYESLGKSTICKTYYGVHMSFYPNGVMKIYGMADGQNISDFIGEVQFDTYPSEEIPNSIDRTCGGDWLLWGHPDWDSTYGDYDLYYSNTNANYLGWKPGTMYSLATVEKNRKIRYTIQSEDTFTCIGLTHDGELYNLASSALK